MEAPVECLTDGKRTFYSKAHPDRAVKEVLFGFALYERTTAGEGEHRGLADQDGAFRWLDGEPLESITAYRVAFQ
jgi:hypothetical protein